MVLGYLVPSPDGWLELGTWNQYLSDTLLMPGFIRQNYGINAEEDESHGA